MIGKTFVCYSEKKTTQRLPRSAKSRKPRQSAPTDAVGSDRANRHLADGFHVILAGEEICQAGARRYWGVFTLKKQTNGCGDQLFLVSWLSICNYTLYQLKLLHALHVGWMRPVDHLGAAGAPQSAQLINPG